MIRNCHVFWMAQVTDKHPALSSDFVGYLRYRGFDPSSRDGSKIGRQARNATFLISHPF
jgi:hypothetical protein